MSLMLFSTVSIAQPLYDYEIIFNSTGNMAESPNKKRQYWHMNYVDRKNGKLMSCRVTLWPMQNGIPEAFYEGICYSNYTNEMLGGVKDSVFSVSGNSAPDIKGFVIPNGEIWVLNTINGQVRFCWNGKCQILTEKKQRFPYS